MRLAPDPITIRIGGEGVTLSPSLRAAMRTAAKHGDFPTALRGVLDGNLTVIADLIREGSANHADLADLSAEIALKGLRIALSELQGPLVEFVLAMAGHDADAPASATPNTGKPISLAEYHAKLFEIATGWLGWTPAEAWAATPAEIEAAFEGRTDMLTAIYGSADDKAKADPLTPERRAEIEAKGMDPDFDRAGLHALKHNNRVR